MEISYIKLLADHSNKPTSQCLVKCKLDKAPLLYCGHDDIILKEYGIKYFVLVENVMSWEMGTKPKYDKFYHPEEVNKDEYYLIIEFEDGIISYDIIEFDDFLRHEKSIFAFVKVT